MFCFIVVTISFNQTMYRANESDRAVEIMVSLSNPSMTDITVQIVSSDITAISESTHITLLSNLPVWHRIHICMYTYIHIKTQDSESRGQEEAGRTRRTSELFTGSTALKLANALNKPPLKQYRLVIKDSAHSNHVELATQQWRKSAPPSLMAPIHAPTLKKPSPWHQFTRLLNN